jgi:hypothetical protein
MYGRKCNTLVIWDNPTDRAVDGLDLLKEMEEKMEKIKKNLKVVDDRQKIYADKNRVFRDFKVGEHVFLKAKEKISSLRLGSFPKMAARYYGPFEILEKIGTVAYILALSTSIRVHDVFHESLLNKYVIEPNHIIDCTMIQVEHEGDFRVEPICILDQKVKVLRKNSMKMVKV